MLFEYNERLRDLNVKAFEAVQSNPSLLEQYGYVLSKNIKKVVVSDITSFTIFIHFCSGLSNINHSQSLIKNSDLANVYFVYDAKIYPECTTIEDYFYKVSNWGVGKAVLAMFKGIEKTYCAYFSKLNYSSEMYESDNHKDFFMCFHRYEKALEEYGYDSAATLQALGVIAKAAEKNNLEKFREEMYDKSEYILKPLIQFEVDEFKDLIVDGITFKVIQDSHEMYSFAQELDICVSVMFTKAVIDKEQVIYSMIENNTNVGCVAINRETNCLEEAKAVGNKRLSKHYIESVKSFCIQSSYDIELIDYNKDDLVAVDKDAILAEIEELQSNIANMNQEVALLKEIIAGRQDQIQELKQKLLDVKKAWKLEKDETIKARLKEEYMDIQKFGKGLNAIETDRISDIEKAIKECVGKIKDYKTIV